MFTINKTQKNGKTPVEFQYALENGHQVMLAGSFNDWAQIPMRFANGNYSVTLKLESGDYEYRFVVDGEWMSDESNPLFSANDFGTLNSVLHLD